MFKNIIFDWSGVIKDAAEDYVWVINRMFGKLGGEKITLKELRQDYEQPYMKFINKYYPKMTMQEQRKLYQEAVLSKECPVSRPYPGIVKLIKKLKKKGSITAVLSGDMAETLFPEMEKFGLNNIFDELTIDVPDKLEAIGDLMKRNNFKKEETVFIGDSNHEVEVGKQAGIKTIAVTWGYYSENRLAELNPTYLVHNVKELEKILLK